MRFDDDSPTSVDRSPLPMETGTLRVSDFDHHADDRRAETALLIVVRSRADLGVHAFVAGRTVIGRNPACALPLHDIRVSWQHAAILPVGNGDYFLEDLRSTNGTRVNGSPVTGQRILKDGDKVFLGETVLRFSLADELDTHFHSEIATLVGTDPLTGLPSKRRFDEALEFSLQASLRYRRPLAVLMMDMDGVKRINDTHGHLFGAHVIGETGRLIARVLGTQGHACRFGGDEFSVFLPGHDRDAACAVGETIRRALESAEIVKDGIPLRPTISIGVAACPEIATDVITLVTRADEALYRAKSSGKNCVAV